jgi:hypothetical protein
MSLRESNCEYAFASALRIARSLPQADYATSAAFWHGGVSSCVEIGYRHSASACWGFELDTARGGGEDAEKRGHGDAGREIRVRCCAMRAGQTKRAVTHSERRPSFCNQNIQSKRLRVVRFGQRFSRSCRGAKRVGCNAMWSGAHALCARYCFAYTESKNDASYFWPEFLKTSLGQILLQFIEFKRVNPGMSLHEPID